jgi:hypothetical protein
LFGPLSRKNAIAESCATCPAISGQRAESAISRLALAAHTEGQRMATYFRHLRLRILVALHGFTAHITLNTRVIRVVRGGTVPPEHAAGGGLRSEGVLHDDRERTRWELARRMCPSSWPISAGTAVWSGPRTGSRGCRRGPSPAAGRRCRACRPTWSPGVTHLCRSTRCRGAADPGAGRFGALADGAAGAGAADPAEDLAAAGGGPAGRRVVHAPGPGDGAGYAPGRAAPL